MDQQIKFCTASDGVSIAYAVTGSGYPLVWIPGWVSHVELDWGIPVFGDWYRSLTKDFTLYRFDKRGTGLSQRGLKKYSRESWVLDVEAVVEHAGLERFALAGYSEGGPTAVDYATRHPEHVSHLILMGTGTVKTGETPRMSEELQALVTITRRHWGSAVKVLTDYFRGEEITPEEQELFGNYQRQSAAPEDAAAMLSVLITAMQIDDLAPKVEAPTLVMHARSDEAIPIHLGQRLASLIPNASFKSIEGHHVPDLEQSRVMGAALREFILGPADTAAEPAQQPASSASLVTILFTDIQSSTALTARLGDAGMQEIRRTHNDIVRAALAAHGGSEIKHTGDGIMASFMSASAGLHCATAIQRSVAEHVAEHPDDPLAVYVGVNAGEPTAEDDPGGRVDLFGTSVDLAARICDQAGPGEILVSDVVRQLVAGKGFLFADRGDTTLRGFEDPVRLFEVRWRD